MGKSKESPAARNKALIWLSKNFFPLVPAEVSLRETSSRVLISSLSQLLLRARVLLGGFAP